MLRLYLGYKLTLHTIFTSDVHELKDSILSNSWININFGTKFLATGKGKG